jgi:hypothetical protein
MTNCDDVRDHIEACEDCQLHGAVEARLRTLPVLEPPKGLVARALRALPRSGPLRFEFFRLAAAAALLLGLGFAAVAGQVSEHRAVQALRQEASQVVKTAMSSLDSWRDASWWR